jgi:hypothetical protein
MWQFILTCFDAGFVVHRPKSKESQAERVKAISSKETKIGRFSPYNFPCFLLKTKPKTFPSEIVNGNGQSLLSATAWPQSDRRAIN